MKGNIVLIHLQKRPSKLGTGMYKTVKDKGTEEMSENSPLGIKVAIN